MTADLPAGGAVPAAHRHPAGTGRTGLRLLLRAGAVLLTGVAVAALVGRFGAAQGGTGADAFPAGLLAAGLLAVAWAFLDGRRGPAAPAVVLWAGVALTAVLVPQAALLAGTLAGAGQRPGMLAVTPGDAVLVLLALVAFALAASALPVLAVVVGAAGARRRG
ncbi:hypothetical protein [Kocuria sp. U4B]